MYTYSEHVPDVAINVFDPIGEQILRQIIDRLGYTDILGERVTIISDYRDSTITKDKNGNAPMMENKIICNMSTNMDPRSLEWETLTTYNISSEANFLRKLNFNYPLFVDKTNRILATTQHVPCIIQLECDVQLLDPNLTHNFMSKMFSLYSNGETFMVTNVTYDYPVPTGLLGVLFELYKLSEHHPDTNFVRYLKQHSKDCITVQTNKYRPASSQLIVEQNVAQLLVKIDYSDDQPNAEKKNKLTLKYLNRFTITIQVSRPSDMYLMYPLTVQNNHIPMSLVPEVDTTEVTHGVRYPNYFIDQYLRSGMGGVPSNMLKYYSTAEIRTIKEQGRYPNLLKDMYVRSSTANYIPSPNYDVWKLPEPVDVWSGAKYNPILTMVFLIEPPDDDGICTTSFNVADALKSMDVHPDLVQYVVDRPDHTIATNEYPVHLHVYRDDRKLDVSALNIDADTNLTVYSCDRSRTHRLVVDILSKENRDGFTPVFSRAYFDIIVSQSRK